MKKFYMIIGACLIVMGLSFQPAYTQQIVIEDFEDSSTVPVWMNANQEAPQPEIVENPLKEGINVSDSVLLWIKAKDSPVWAAAMTELEAYDIVFEGEATYLHIKMLKDNTDPAALQIIRTDDGMEESDKYPEPPVRLPCPFPNEWVDYVYDFSDPDVASQSWSRFYFMAVMNATEEGGWEADPLDEDVYVYIDDIILDSDPEPYTDEDETNTVFVDREGNVSYILKNPVTTEMVFSGIEDVEQITVYNINGSVVRQINTGRQHSYQLQVSDLQQGIYMVKFDRVDGTSEVSKIIKQ